MLAPSDCLARVRTDLNALAWFLVFLNDEGQAYVERYGKWVAVQGLAGFEAYEPVKTKVRTLYDTATNELIGAI